MLFPVIPKPGIYKSGIRIMSGSKPDSFRNPGNFGNIIITVDSEFLVDVGIPKVLAIDDCYIEEEPKLIIFDSDEKNYYFPLYFVHEMPEVFHRTFSKYHEYHPEEYEIAVGMLKIWVQIGKIFLNNPKRHLEIFREYSMAHEWVKTTLSFFVRFPYKLIDIEKFLETEDGKGITLDIVPDLVGVIDSINDNILKLRKTKKQRILFSSEKKHENSQNFRR